VIGDKNTNSAKPRWEVNMHTSQEGKDLSTAESEGQAMIRSALHRPDALPHRVQQSREALVDRLWFALLLVAVFAVPISVSRAWSAEWAPVHTLHLLVGLCTAAVAVFHRDLPFKLKAVLFLASLWVLGLSGMHTLGGLTAGFLWLIVSVVVGGVLFSVRLGVILALCAALVLSLATYGLVHGLLTPAAGAAPESTQVSDWVESLIAGSMLFLAVSRSLAVFNQAATAALAQGTRQWFGGLPIGVFVLRPDYRVHYANPQVTEILGREFLSGMHIADLLNEIGGFKKDSYIPYPVGELPAVRALTGESSVVEDMEIVRDGQRRTLRISGYPLYDDAGKVSHGLAAVEDISEREQVQADLIAARAQAEAETLAKGQMVANMSQEIRAPVNAILGLLDLLQTTPLTSQQKDYVQKTGGAARSLLGFLNDFSDLSRADTGKLRLDLQPIRMDTFMSRLSTILSSYVGDKSIEVLFDIDPAVPGVLLGDAMRLQQVLSNLGGNAVKFTDAGEVVLRVGLKELRDQLAQVEFRVQDSGIGIAPEDQKHLFRGFSQAAAATRRRFGGTGLGLAISQKLVALMGGELQFHSELGSGSTFYFTLALPVAVDPAEEFKPAALAAPIQRKTLVVDDNRAAGELLLKLAKQCGLAAQLARSGREALALISEQTRYKATPFEVILLDWQMQGMDGWETASQIRQICKDTGTPEPKIIMMATHGREILAKRTPQEQANIHSLLIKPVTASMLTNAIVNAEPAGFGIRRRARSSSSPQRLSGMRVLLVEDSLLDQQIAEELLKSEGARVSLATNGLLGVAAVATANEPFDAVLMDVQMPVMDGYDATRAIREQLGMASLPIIAMTANARPADRNICLEAGMTEALEKPFGLSEVVSVLVRHTGFTPQGGRRSDEASTTT
jgi:PAS domain S-box-containing protein